MPPITRGDRRHLVTLRNPGAPIPDGRGGFTYVYTDLSPATMFAAVQPAAAGNLERERSDTNLATATHLLTMDFHPQVTTETRIWLEDGAALNVTGVRNPDAQGIDLELTCEALLP
jgi:head-tail adaptor